jgi:predicted aconitase
MRFKIGQVEITLSDDGIRFVAPLADHEISVKIRYAPETENPLGVSLSLWKTPMEKPDAQ